LCQNKPLINYHNHQAKKALISKNKVLKFELHVKNAYAGLLLIKIIISIIFIIYFNYDDN